MSRANAARGCADGSGPHAVDRHVGLRLKLLRKARGWTQERLGQAAGITFQQVQKYERGLNRLSASRLWEIARALQVPVAYFFEGLEDPAEAAAGCGLVAAAQEFLVTREGRELARWFPGLPAALRRRVLELMRSLAEADETAESSPA